VVALGGGEGLQTLVKEYGFVAVLFHSSVWVVTASLVYSYISSGAADGLQGGFIPEGATSSLFGRAGATLGVVEATGPVRTVLTISATPKVAPYVRQVPLLVSAEEWVGNALKKFQQEKAAPAARTAREKAVLWAEDAKASASARFDAAVEDSKAFVSERASEALERVGLTEWAEDVRERLGQVSPPELTPPEALSQWLEEAKSKLGISAEEGEPTDSAQGVSQWLEARVDDVKNQLGLVEEQEDDAPQGMPQWMEDLKEKLGVSQDDPKPPPKSKRQWSLSVKTRREEKAQSGS
jgi:hypothetical protein